MTVAVDGVAVTTPARTAFDIAAHGAAVQRLDALDEFPTDVIVADVQAATPNIPVRAAWSACAVLPLIDGGAESPQETWT